MLTAGFAEGLTNFHSFAQETKIKGPMTAIGEALYFACDKGGAGNFGYIGSFDTRNQTLQPLYEFTRETKVKDGFTRVGDELWFVCERSGDYDFGFIGAFNLTSKMVSVLHHFPVETRPKSAPIQLNNDGWYFLTERAGSENLGALMRYAPGAGVATVASFTIATGIKAESKPFWHNGRVYYAAREGGDTNQLAGKGAGAIGFIDLAAGTVTKLADLQAATTLAKIKTLLPVNERLYYTAEEGGDMTLNSGKGFGGLGYYDPARNAFTTLLVCDATTTGTKPRGLLPVEDKLYFNCGEGGANGFGTFGVINNGSQVEILGANDLVIGAKSDVGITRHGNSIYFATELGCANYLGGISAFELPASVTVGPPQLLLTVNGNVLELSWPADAGDFVLESNSDLKGEWQPLTQAGTSRAQVPLSAPEAFFRLRR